jgi:hypothetical protein
MPVWRVKSGTQTKKTAPKKSGLVTSFGPSRVILDQLSEPPELDLFCAAKRGNSNEKNNRKCGTLTSADVFDSDGRGTCRRRCVGGGIGCRGARADRCRRRSCHRLYGRPVDFAFVGREPLERAAPCAKSRKLGRSYPFRRQSTRVQSVCAQRSSSSSGGRPSAAVRHHHGFHRAAGPATGVSRYYC